MANSVWKRIMRTGVGTLFTASLCVLLWHCSDKSIDPDEDIARELSKVESQLVASDNSFGIKLF